MRQRCVRRLHARRVARHARREVARRWRHAAERRAVDELKRVKVDVDPGPSTAEIYIRNTPNNNFSATIEVPRRSDLWIRLTAGQLDVGPVEGDKNLEIRAGQLEVAVPDPEQYGHRDAGVLTGSIEASAFHVSKGGLFRSFEQAGSGKYRLHAHVMTGEIDLR